MNTRATQYCMHPPPTSIEIIYTLSTNSSEAASAPPSLRHAQGIKGHK